MCMLSYFPAGVVPNEEHIRNGADVNPDGHGYAIVTGDKRLLIHKGMNADEMIERFMDARERNPEGPAMFHSRIATSGLVDVTGCHPFHVGNDRRTVVAHNGILFSPPADSHRSDTRIFAEDILPQWRRWDRKRVWAKIEKYAGYSNKLVMLTVDPLYQQTSYVVNQAQGWWVGKEWHSNHDYDGYSAHSWTSARKSWWGEDDKWGITREGCEPWPCDLCGAINAVDKYTLVCTACRSCNDCLEWVEDCQCFYKGGAAKSAAESAKVFMTSAELTKYDRDYATQLAITAATPKRALEA